MLAKFAEDSPSTPGLPLSLPMPIAGLLYSTLFDIHYTARVLTSHFGVIVLVDVRKAVYLLRRAAHFYRSWKEVLAAPLGRVFDVRTYICASGVAV